MSDHNDYCLDCMNDLDKCNCPQYGGHVSIPGVGPDAPTVTNATGGKQSASLYRCDLLPAFAVLAVASILKHGADKYGPNNWRKIPAVDHVNHAMIHLFSYLAGDLQDDHLGHAACRLLMALEVTHAPTPNPLVMAMAERIHAQHELLAKRAERKG